MPRLARLHTQAQLGTAPPISSSRTPSPRRMPLSGPTGWLTSDGVSDRKIRLFSGGQSLDLPRGLFVGSGLRVGHPTTPRTQPAQPNALPRQCAWHNEQSPFPKGRNQPRRSAVPSHTPPTSSPAPSETPDPNILQVCAMSHQGRKRAPCKRHIPHQFANPAAANTSRPPL